ncbi:MAG TPA: metalloregulator ArsR/SmtB family transcription factor [Chloroflexi bacterium]|nr:metalloregulator ArsR/SmtB family transcription factor [Chloroflexota bacterium]
MHNPQLAEEVTRLHADFCFALADARRLLILYALDAGPKNVTELTKTLAATQPTISRHLKILRERGLVTATREGTSVVYRLADRRLIEALDLLRAVMRDQWVRKAELMDSES